MSHNLFEGRKCVEAAEKYRRIVQHGTQSRSVASWRRTAAAIASEEHGKLLVAKAYASKVRWSIGFRNDQPAPETLDFNLWLGPAAKRPFNRCFVHYNWHWFWDFGNGEIGNQGAHQFHTTEGVLTSGEFTPHGADKSQSLGVEAKTWAENEFNHLIFKNFIDCVRSRKREDLHADVLEAHRSIGLCHLGNISYRLGEQVPGDTPIPIFGDNQEVQKSWQRIKQGLKDALGIDLASTTYQLGKLLEFDPQKEQFVGNQAANRLLTREYREPFVVPATV
jgi:hypothetical protein